MLTLFFFLISKACFSSTFFSNYIQKQRPIWKRKKTSLDRQEKRNGKFLHGVVGIVRWARHRPHMWDPHHMRVSWAHKYFPRSGRSYTRILQQLLRCILCVEIISLQSLVRCKALQPQTSLLDFLSPSAMHTDHPSLPPTTLQLRSNSNLITTSNHILHITVKK